MLPGAARIHPMSVPVSWSAVQQRLAGLLAPASNCYRPLRIGGQVAGWIAPERVERLRAFADVFRVAKAGAAQGDRRGLSGATALTSMARSAARTL